MPLLTYRPISDFGFAPLAAPGRQSLCPIRQAHNEVVVAEPLQAAEAAGVRVRCLLVPVQAGVLRGPVARHADADVAVAAAAMQLKHQIAGHTEIDWLVGLEALLADGPGNLLTLITRVLQFWHGRNPRRHTQAAHSRGTLERDVY